MNQIIETKSEALTKRDFHALAEIPPELEWWANFSNPKTQRAYRLDIQDFMAFASIASPQDMRSVTRTHVIAWRTALVRNKVSGTFFWVRTSQSHGERPGNEGRTLSNDS